jgi:hypothetical protein
MKMRKLFLLLLIVVIGLPIFAEEKGYYALVYKRSNLNASIDLNDVSVSRPSKDGFASGQMNANLWIMPGENTIKVKITDLSKGKSSFGPKIEVRLFLAQEGQMPDEGKKIAELIIAESENEKLTLPLEKEIKFTPEFVPPSDLWTSAEKTELTDADKKEVQEIIKQTHKAINTANKDEVLKLMEFKERDMAKAYYIDPEESLKSNTKMMTSFFKEIKGKLDPISKKLDYKFVANGLVLVVTEPNGKDPIHAKSKDGGVFSFPISVSKIGGKWILVR